MLSLFRPRSPIPPQPSVTISPTKTLSDALKSFQDCLDSEQKAKFEAISAVPDAHAVAVFTHQLDQENAKRRSRCVAARLSPLLESVQQFSGVVETFVSSHPQVAALIWGSVKLVLQIASNFTTYFDKLSTLLMTIGKRCPRFQEYQKLYRSSIDLQKALCEFYAVVVRCCEQAVLAIRQTGYIQLLKAVTGSFDSEFDSILTQINRSSDEVKETIRLVEAKLSISERQDQRLERDEALKHRLESIIHRKDRMKAEAERLTQKQLERRRIRQASKLEQLSSFNNKIAYWKIRTQRHSSTGQWLTRTNQFNEWITGGSPSVFWCTGNLGSGKTVMTGYVVELLSAKYRQSTEKLVYFFCQYDNESSLQATTILRSVIRQVLDQDDGTFAANERELEALLDNPHDLDSLERLLFSIVDNLKSTVVILDGIDECSLPEIKSLLRILRNLTLRPSGLKLYLAGDDRITDLVETFLNPSFLLNTHLPEAASDLKELVQQLVDARREDGDLVAGDPYLYHEIVDVLCTASQGMILWVKFQLEELCFQKTDENIRLTMQHLPKNIFETYNRLLSRINKEGSVETCNRVFQYVAAAKRPLTLDELGETISLEPCQPCFIPERLINNTKGIVRWCHGLVALHDLDDTVQFAHSSVKDFFCSLETKQNILQGFHFQQGEADLKLGEVCVTYLNFNDFKTQLIKFPSPKPQFLDPMMMASHTLSTRSPNVILDKAMEFMRTRSISTSATSKLLLPQASDRANYAATKSYRFLQYASEFWLSHTSKFSPDQGKMWTLFKTLAEQHYLVLSEPDNQSSLRYSNSGPLELRDFALYHQHQALFRLWIARIPNENDQVRAMAFVLRSECFAFVKLFPPLDKRPDLSWQEAVLSLEPEDLRGVLARVGPKWTRALTTTERSELLCRVVGDPNDKISDVVGILIEIGVDPYYGADTQGLAITLFEKLILERDLDPLRVLCEAMRRSDANFDRRISVSGRTALHVAAKMQYSAVIELLLRYGAFVDGTDDFGQTPLHIVARAMGEASMC